MSLPAYWQQSKEFLTYADPKLAKLILEHQQYSISSRGEALETLLRSIVGQQISVQAAASVWGKVRKKNWQNETRKRNFDELRRT